MLVQKVAFSNTILMATVIAAESSAEIAATIIVSRQVICAGHSLPSRPRSTRPASVRYGAASVRPTRSTSLLAELETDPQPDKRTYAAEEQRCVGERTSMP